MESQTVKPNHVKVIANGVMLTPKYKQTNIAPRHWHGANSLWQDSYGIFQTGHRSNGPQVSSSLLDPNNPLLG